MDIVIPYRYGKWGNTELRFALRSACRYLPGGCFYMNPELVQDKAAYDGQIFIIGNYPGLSNIIHIPAQDQPESIWKERNIYNKILIACNDPRVSDDFIFMNDDHFLLPGFDINKNYCSDWGSARPDLYEQTKQNTLPHMFRSSPFYDVHCPIIFNKVCFKDFLKKYDWSVKAGYCMKTLYSYNLLNNSVECTDLKLQDVDLTSIQIKKLLRDRLFFSTHDRMRTDSMLKVLNELYPTKTIYE